MLSARWLQRHAISMALVGSFIPAAYSQNLPPADDTQACIQSICGKENPLSHPFDNSPSLKKWTTSMIDVNMKKPIQDYMGRIIHRALIMDQAYKKLSSSKLSFTPEQAAFIQTLRYANNFTQYAGALEQEKFGYYFNIEKLKKLLPNASENELNAIQSLKEIINASQIANRFRSLSYESVLGVFYPTMKLVDAQQMEAYRIATTKSEVQKLVPLAEVMRSDQLILDKALKRESLSIAEQAAMKDLIFSRMTNTALLSVPVQQAFSKLPLDIDLALKEGQQKYAQSETGQALANPKSVKKYLTDSVEKCAADLSYSYAALPTNAQIETFKNLLNLVKEKARGMMEEKTKTSLPNAFSAEVYLPKARESAIKDWQNSIQIAQKTLEGSVKSLKKINSNDPRTMESVAMFLIVNGSEKLFTPVLSFCKEAQPPFLSDAAIRTTGVINLSWPTIVHPEVGITIIAHEIGHVASAKFPDVLKGEQQCLADRQSSSTYIEEDFADLFAAEIFNRFGGKIAETKLSQLGCGLLDRIDNAWAPGRLKAHPNDSHSANFYRLLSGATMTSQMTPQCNDYLKSHNVRQFNNYCQWQK